MNQDKTVAADRSLGGTERNGFCTPEGSQPCRHPHAQTSSCA